MQKLKFKKSFIAALGLFLGVALTGVAHAQTAQIGVVDEDKLADGYKKYKDIVDQIDKRAQKMDQQIPAREFLNDDDGKVFDGLMVKTPLTDAEQKQLDNLVKSGLDKRAQFMGIIGKANRSEAEASQMKNMQDQMTKNGPAVRKLSEDLLAAIRKQQDDTDQQYTNNANTVVAQVAADKKLLLVVRKRAVVWNSDSIDITTEVLSRLNK